MALRNSIQSVIVGVDFSKASRAAMAQARFFSEAWDVPLVAVHAFDDPVVSEAGFQSIIKGLKEFYEKRVRRFYKLRDEDQVVVECGRPWEKIIKAARSRRQPLIVLGHRGQTRGFERFILGSTAERLATKSPFPVWVHRGSGSARVRKILIPTDLSDRAPHTAAEAVKMGFEKKTIDLYHVIAPAVPLLDYEGWRRMNEEVERANQKALTAFKKRYPTFKVKEEWGAVAEMITKQAKSYDAVALSPRSKKGFFSGFGSVTSKVVRTSPIPILVIP